MVSYIHYPPTQLMVSSNDSNSDYLHYLVCSGLMFALPFILFLYDIPWATRLQIILKDRSSLLRLYTLLLFSITFPICSPSNANRQIHQISTELLLFATTALRYRDEGLRHDPGG